MEALLLRTLPVIGLICLASLIELFIPLRKQFRNQDGRLQTNIILIATTLGLGLFLNAALAIGAAYINSKGLGLFNLLNISGVIALFITIVILDFSAYVVHVLMHKTSWAWRFHQVHHIDKLVDSTTALRQHPFESVLRFTFTAIFAWSLGATAGTIAIYRLLSAGNAVFEHANIRIPKWLNSSLIWFWVTPDMHKIHHSRRQIETDSNYANLFSWHDRLFRTFTPVKDTGTINFGIHGFDAPSSQSVKAVLSMPFRGRPA